MCRSFFTTWHECRRFAHADDTEALVVWQINYQQRKYPKDVTRRSESAKCSHKDGAKSFHKLSTTNAKVDVIEFVVTQSERLQRLEVIPKYLSIASVLIDKVSSVCWEGWGASNESVQVAVEGNTDCYFQDPRYCSSWICIQIILSPAFYSYSHNKSHHKGTLHGGVEKVKVTVTVVQIGLISKENHG